MGAGQSQAFKNDFEHCGSFLADLVIPESKHAKSLRFDSTITTLVGYGSLLVLAAVKFDYELRIKTCEVGNITAYWNLAPKAMTSQLLASQVLPQIAFRVCAFNPE